MQAKQACSGQGKETTVRSRVGDLRGRQKDWGRRCAGGSVSERGEPEKRGRKRESAEREHFCRRREKQLWKLHQRKTESRGRTKEVPTSAHKEPVHFFHRCVYWSGGREGEASALTYFSLLALNLHNRTIAAQRGCLSKALSPSLNVCMPVKK